MENSTTEPHHNSYMYFVCSIYQTCTWYMLCPLCPIELSLILSYGQLPLHPHVTFYQPNIRKKNVSDSTAPQDLMCVWVTFQFYSTFILQASKWCAHCQINRKTKRAHFCQCNESDLRLDKQRNRKTYASSDKYRWYSWIWYTFVSFLFSSRFLPRSSGSMCTAMNQRIKQTQNMTNMSTTK